MYSTHTHVIYIHTISVTLTRVTPVRLTRLAGGAVYIIRIGNIIIIICAMRLNVAPRPPRGLTHNSVRQIDGRDVGAWSHMATPEPLDKILYLYNNNIILCTSHL